MARKPKIAAAVAGHNSELGEEAMSIIREETARIIKLEKDRAQINADINASRSAIKAAGVDLDAWRASKRRYDMDREKRDLFDMSTIAVNQALGIPLQGALDLGDGDDKPQGEGLPTIN